MPSHSCSAAALPAAWVGVPGWVGPKPGAGYGGRCGADPGGPRRGRPRAPPWEGAELTPARGREAGRTWGFGAVLFFRALKGGRRERGGRPMGALRAQAGAEPLGGAMGGVVRGAHRSWAARAGGKGPGRILWPRQLEEPGRRTKEEGRGRPAEASGPAAGRRRGRRRRRAAKGQRRGRSSQSACSVTREAAAGKAAGKEAREIAGAGRSSKLDTWTFRCCARALATVARPERKHCQASSSSDQPSFNATDARLAHQGGPLRHVARIHHQ